MKTHKILLYLAGLIFILSSPVLSQTYYFDEYSVKDGLAQSTIYDILQDEQGYLWLGTKSGVSRFDGSTFINYTEDDGLAKNGVTSIYQDSKNNIWFGHADGGLSRIFHGKFQRYENNGVELNSRVTDIIEDKSGQLWIGTDGNGALLIANPQIDSLGLANVKMFKGQEGLSDQVFSFFKTRTGELYFVTNVGIKVYSSSESKFEYLKLDGLSNFSQITAIYEDVKGNLWFGSWTNGLQKYNINKATTEAFFKRDGLGSNFITSITGTEKGDIWVGTWEGGITRISVDMEFTTFSTANGLPNNKIWKTIIDKEGNVIIGTNENGLAIFKGEKFILFNENEKLVNEQVFAICQDDSSHFWAGTNGGLTIFDFANGQYKKIKNMTYTSGILPSDQIRFLKKDKSGTIWMGTNDYKVWEKKNSDRHFKYNTFINRWFPRNISSVTALDIDKDNNLWVGTVEGLIYYEIDSQKSDLLTQTHGLAGNEISAIYCDPVGNIWIGSKGKGITLIHGSSIEKVDVGQEFTAKSMILDKDGYLWVGTEGQGVFRIKDEQVDQFTTAEGLLSDYITAINADEQGRIYIGTNLGLNIYDQKLNRFFAYTSKSGFTGIEVKDNAIFIDNAGNVWIGTVNGLILYQPGKDVHHMNEPLTSISELTVNLKKRTMKPGLKLKYTEKTVSFDFTSICFADPSQVRYQYYLEGAEESWNPPTVQNHISYSPLPPGKYTFMLRAINNEGVWNSKPVSYHFRIRPPFWKTWPFYITVVILAILIILTYIQVRTRNLIREKRILEEKVAERTAEVVAQKEQIEKEKEKSEELLLNILPQKVVVDLKKTGTTIPENFDEVTAFFSDIVGFTNMSAKLDPKVLIDELNDIFTAFDDIMTKHNCERLKTIGDAYLAVCGMPEKNKKHAENIVKASIDIIKYMNKRNNTSQYKWKMRIGINSGPVVGGVVGIRKYIYDVFGDTINTSSRMESNSEPMRINVSETTYSLVKDKFKFTEREPRDVKGKGQMKMFFVEI